MTQLALLSDHRALFDPSELRQRARNVHEANFPRDGLTRLETWRNRLHAGEVDERNEEQLRPDFIRDIFSSLLGHRTIGDEGLYNLRWEERRQVPAAPGRTHPSDGTLGFYGPDTSETRAVIELKPPGTNLDRPGTGPGRMTAVEQGFRNASEFDDCRWVIVSNFETLRLYSSRRGKFRYEEFALAELRRDDERLRQFFWLLHVDNLLRAGDDPSPTDQLAAHTWRRQDDLTAEFYEDYRNQRRRLIAELRNQNPETSTDEIVKAAQQLLDRVLFIHFCSDRGLLSPQRVNAIREIPRPRSFMWEPHRVWNSLRALFRAVDEGHAPDGIPEYNGGLFRQSLVDDLALDERRERGDGPFVLRSILEWAELDFQSQLDVDVLGHVFEQSISDLEAIRGQIREGDGEADQPQEQRREQGIFYTPDWVTGHIVASVVGRYLEALEDEATVEDLPRVIDPACGSGAFLTQALRQLLELPSERYLEDFDDARVEGMPLFENVGYQQALRARGILRGQIFGVDLLPESVEIAKLSLWLQTAHNQLPLTDLDANVRSGNTLCGDTNHAEHGGFDWEESFGPQVGDGFDLVVSNPPWGADLSGYEGCVEETFDLATGQYDSFDLFLERAFALLRNPADGTPPPLVGFVVPDSLFQPEHEETRRLLARDHTILQIIKLGEGVFENVYRAAAIVICAKGEADDEHEVLGLTVTNDDRQEITDVTENVNLSTLISERGNWIRQGRFRQDEHCRFQIFSGERDYEIMDRMEEVSIEWEGLLDSGRGVELGATGEILRCPNCMRWATYPRRRAQRRGGGYYPKTCEHCEAEFEFEQAAGTDRIIFDPAELYPGATGPGDVELADDEEWLAVGESVERYSLRRLRIIRTGRDGINYKDPSDYGSPKMLFRKTGVGIWATIDYDDIYTNQVVYIYQLNDEDDAGPYDLEYFLGVMNSRLMLYYYYKSTGEIEWKSFPYVTQAIIEQMPVKAIDFEDQAEQELHDEISNRVRDLLAGPPGGMQEEDFELERRVMDLYGLDENQRGHVFSVLNNEVQRLRIVREVLPEGTQA